MTFVKTFGGKGYENGQFEDPWAIAVKGKEVFVADTSNNRVQIMTNNGDFVTSFKCESPSGIEVDQQGDIYIAELFKGVVIKVNRQGNEMQVISSDGSGPQQLKHPTGIKLDDNENLFVADYGNGRVQMFGKDGKWIKQIGSKGTGVNELSGPRDVGVDGKGNIYVSDINNKRVQVYNIETGEHVRQIGRKGRGKGGVEHPWGLMVRGNGEVIVGEIGGRMQWFGGDGKWTGECCGFKECDHFKGVTAIAEDENEELFVMDYGNDRIVKMK